MNEIGNVVKFHDSMMWRDLWVAAQFSPLSHFYPCWWTLPAPPPPPHFFCHSHFELVPQTHTLQGVPPHLSAVNKGPGMASSGSMTMAQCGHQPVCCCKSKKIKSRTSQVDWFSFWETSHFLLRVTQVNTTSFQWVSVDTRLVFTSNCSNQVFSQ